METDARCGSRAFLAGALLCLLFGCLSGVVQASPIQRHAEARTDEEVPAFASLALIKSFEKSVQSSLQDLELSRKKHKTALTDKDLDAMSHVKCNVTTIEIPDNAGAKEILDSGKKIKKSKKHRKEEAMRIYNGQIVTDKNMFPQIVALMYMQADGAGTPFCTASLLDGQIVLSAAHCLQGQPITGSMIACVSAVDTKVDTGNCAVVTKAEVAPGYTDAVLGLNDIMILVLDRNIITDGVKRMKISFTEEAQGTETVSVGYGYNTPGIPEVDGKLRFVDSRAVKGDQCRMLVGRDAQLTFDMVCSDGNYDGSLGGICSGDSGSPLVRPGDVPENHVQIGVASFAAVTEALDCRPEFEGAYVNTWSDRTRTFLETEVAANGGSLLVDGAGGDAGGNDLRSFTCQDQVNACVNGVDLQCGEVAPTAECCTQLEPALKCVLNVANVCGDVDLAARMQQSLATLERDCPAEGAAFDCPTAAAACAQLGPLDCLALPLTDECCNATSPVIDCYLPLTNGCLAPESADYVRNVKGYLDGSCPNNFYY